MVETLFFAFIVLVLATIQFMLMSVMWQRFMRLLRVQEARTARFVIRSYGADDRATYRALAKHTRLDLQEIDELIERRALGALPTPLSDRQAGRLADDLRANGAEVEIEHNAFPIDTTVSA